MVYREIYTNECGKVVTTTWGFACYTIISRSTVLRWIEDFRENCSQIFWNENFREIERDIEITENGLLGVITYQNEKALVMKPIIVLEYFKGFEDK